MSTAWIVAFVGLLGVFYFIGYLRGGSDERKSYIRRRTPGSN